MSGRGQKYAVAAVAITVVAAIVELAMGRLLLCRCGYLKFWHGVVYSSENSQHLTDWYTFTHVLHGLGFYFLLWVVFRRLGGGVRFLMAVALESAWEIVENSTVHHRSLPDRHHLARLLRRQRRQFSGRRARDDGRVLDRPQGAGMGDVVLFIAVEARWRGGFATT